MSISGFTMAKNTSKLYYPIKESIESILPIVDEFVIALGDCDEDDTTRELVNSINSDKVRIIDTVWDLEKYPNGMENAHQTDIAMRECKGDWLFYVQADEVVHEDFLPEIKQKCEQYKDDERVEGFLFNYLHFYGDYNHHINFHGWYPEEIRIVRNKPDIHSFQSAQSFRRIPEFDGVSYRKKVGTFKLNVIKLDAYIYHYGWVRPPKYMQSKSKALNTIHHGKKKIDAVYDNLPDEFDYGNMHYLPKFTGTHPAIMKDKIATFDWADKLHYEKGYTPKRPKMKHEKLKYRIATFIEHVFFKGKPPYGYKNWQLLRK